MIRRLGLIVLILLAGVVPARAQNCVTVNGISRCTQPWQIYDSAQRQTSLPVLDLTQIWNQAATTFTGVKLNVTDTNSASGSLLLDLQVGGTSKFSVTKAGSATFAAPVLFPNGTAALPGASFATETNKGLFSPQTNVITVSLSGSARMAFDSSGTNNQLNLFANYLAWAPSASYGDNADTFVTRGGAAGKIVLTGTTPMIQLGGTTSSFPALKQSGGANVFVRTADDSAFAPIYASAVAFTGSLFATSSGVLLTSALAPTISSGFGTSPTIANNNGTAAFTVNVGTGGAASSGVVGLPTATTGWNCFVNDLTAAAAHVAYNTRQTASSTTTATLENQTTSTGAAVAWAASDILRVSCFAY